jgi:alpha-L-fucosidase
MPDGRMEARQVKRLKEMGEWLKIYGESIYGTKGGPFRPNEIFAATRKGNKLYIHVFEKKSNSLTLPAIAGIKVKQAYLLKGDKIVYTQDAGGAITLQFPGQLPDSNDSVIVLELTANAETIPVAS